MISIHLIKGSALTYDEMDRNQSQFFYSSSKSPDGLKLRLHYTGSDNLDTTEDYGPTRYHEVSFPVFQSEVPDSNVAGNNTEIQFNTTVGEAQNFDAKSTFVFTKNNNSVGIGTATPLQRLDIHGDGQRSGTIALRGSINNEDQEQGNASVKFYNGLNEESLLGQIGRIEYTAAAKDDIYIHAGGYTANTSGLVPDSTTPAVFHISLGKLTTSVRPYDKIGATFKRIGDESKINVGINNNNPTLLNLSVVGNQGIGVSSSSLLAAGHSIIKPLSSSGGSFYNQLTNNQHTLVTNDSIADGIEISSPETANGGNILVIVNTDSNEKESFNIITARQGVGSTGKLLATFQASGKVGIGTNTPLHEGLTIEEELTIRGLETGTSVSTKTLVATSTGLVKQIAAAPVPIGGIIMWSGTIANIPDGWALCNGVSASNGVAVPNLTNKFIIASSNSTGIPTTTILGTGATSTGGSTSYTPGGTLTLAKLLQTDIAPHHHFFLADDRLYNNLNTNYPNNTDSVGGPGSSSSTAATGVRTIGGYDADSDYSGNRRVYATSKNSRYTNHTQTTIMQTLLKQVLPEHLQEQPHQKQ